jgi:acyl carrier protein
MTTSRTPESIRADLMTLLATLREDWEYSEPLTDETGLFRDLGFESIDAVALGGALESHFGQQLPFAEFLTIAKDRKLEDISIGYLVEFLVTHLHGAEARV